MRLADVKNPQRGHMYKQFWFDEEGVFLAAPAHRTGRLFYSMMSPKAAKVRRWKRYYDVPLATGQIVIRYCQDGRGHYWERHKVLWSGELWMFERHRGTPPWMKRKGTFEEGVGPLDKKVLGEVN